MVGKRQTEQQIISQFTGPFDHAHNQYLADLSKQGALGLIALLSIFFVPFYYFMCCLNTNSLAQKTLALLGVVYIISTMFYYISQGFFTHNSGNTFYFFLIIIFYSALKAFEVSRIQKNLLLLCLVE